jgi:hypothetical protein
MTNKEICSELGKLLMRDLYQINSNNIKCSISPCKINDYSFTFCLFLNKQPYSNGLFVKIPKTYELKRTIDPITIKDRKLGTEEYRSLSKLSNKWNSEEIKVHFVTPINYYEEYNAIIIEYLPSSDFFSYLRTKDLLRRLKLNVSEGREAEALFDLGAALRRFHQQDGVETQFSMARVVEKIARYCADLEAYGVSQEYLRPVGKIINGLAHSRTETLWTDTIKGLDVRNILMDRGDRIYLVDPGKMEKDYREADLARFIVTLRILYWGSLWFFIGITPDEIYETKFLHGYYERKPNRDIILTTLIIQEYLKHWRRAYRALSLKRWPSLMKSFIKLAYIDAFYQKQIALELLKLQD